MELQKWIDKGFDLITSFGPKVIASILIWIIGIWIIRVMLRNVRKLMDKKDLDVSLKKFLLNLLNWVLKILLYM